MSRRLRLIAVASLPIAALALSACTTGKTDDGKPSVVASTSVWGSIASAVAGDDARVTSVITDIGADPHSFELSPAQAASITDADLVVLNGGHYDEAVEDVTAASRNDDLAIVDAFELRSNQADENEHVWFDHATVLATARAIADELAEIDPPHADGYRTRADEFETAMKPLQNAVAKITADHPNAPVTATEPLAHYLVVDAQLRDLTPPDFQEAVEQGSDPAPAAIAAFGDLLRDKRVEVLIYNTQSADATTVALRKIAEDAGVRVIEVTETLPSGQSYLEWQMSTIDQLSEALS